MPSENGHGGCVYDSTGEGLDLSPSAISNYHQT